MDNNYILSVLQRIRPILRDSVSDPEKVIHELACIVPSRQMVFPCDIIDLRNIFREKKITFNFPIPLFSYRFAEKFLKDYSIFLIIDSDRIEFDSVKYGGVSFIHSDFIPITDNLIRIIVNEPTGCNSFLTVKSIVKEFNIGAECLVSNTVPVLAASNIVKKNAQVEKDISLTPEEKEIFKILIEAKRAFNLPVEFRVAGGWVRDKLLNKNSDDIDIAVGMPGYDIAQAVYQFGIQKGLNVKEPYRVSLDKSAVPAQQGEKTNDLMVGSVVINGVKIEFVPMRTESYPDPNSRKPVITTTQDPREDVKRRDLTINSILYNIETGQIEDYVGGKKDLLGETIVLRTPDESYKTFMEDPLRMLRVLRFHSKYPNSKIDPDIIKSMKDPSVQEAYHNKVATERAGPEIMKMMMSEDPVSSLHILFDSGLYKSVFNVPSMEGINPEGIHMDQKTHFHKYNLKDHTIEVVKNLNNIMKQKNESSYMRGLMNIGALFHDFGKMKTQSPNEKDPGRMSYIGHEKVSAQMADEILKSIGVGEDDRNIVKQVIRLHMKPLQSGEWSNKGRGSFLRETRMPGKEEEHKDLWKYIFYHAQADSMSSQPEKYDDSKQQELFNNFSNYVNSPQGKFTKPILNGNDIINIFESFRPFFPSIPSPSTGYIKEVLDMIKEKQDQGIINLSFIDMEEGPEKQSLMNNAREQASMEVKKEAPRIITKYTESNKMSSNWFRKIRGQSIPEGSSPTCEDPEIVKGPDECHHKFRKGMRVRDRRKGMVNPQEYGIVDYVKGNEIGILWNPDDKKNKKKDVFDATKDSEILALIVAEV